MEAPLSADAGTEPKSQAKPSTASFRSGAILGGAIELIGVALLPGRASPGEVVKVTAYFKVLKKVEADYSVFVHLEDAQGQLERLNADHKPGGGLASTRSWKVGDTIKDEFSVKLPTHLPTTGLNLLMGMWNPASDQRLEITNPDVARHDGKNRVIIGQLSIDP